MGIKEEIDKELEEGENPYDTESRYDRVYLSPEDIQKKSEEKAKRLKWIYRLGRIVRVVYIGVIGLIVALVLFVVYSYVGGYIK